ncbi:MULTISPECIES: hypothetical protein [Psychrobacter]|uniref:hypothetical protein n=1 Tax=Psychrobacter TaxID=497 RepID=UPI0007F44AEB|nr:MULTISPECIES: hypothetical protein [Psychrobacter]OAP70194.1 hypothetical protein A7325_02890 [Psychrobacter sp. SHUES1]
MRHLAPYQTGLWLAEYGDIRCQLCRLYRSASQSQHLPTHSSPSPPNKHSFFAKLRQQVNNRFNSGLLCSDCHNSIAWRPKPFEVDIASGTVLSIQAATYYDYPIRQAIRALVVCQKVC